MLRFDETRTLPEIPVPTLVLVGHLDRMTVPEAARFIARSIPAADEVTLQPGGHMSIFERNDQFTAAVTAFADRVQVA
jgi:pimeloyl-ACP methyl ester carboxylesterase